MNQGHTMASLIIRKATAMFEPNKKHSNKINFSGFVRGLLMLKEGCVFLYIYVGDEEKKSISSIFQQKYRKVIQSFSVPTLATNLLLHVRALKLDKDARF